MNDARKFLIDEFKTSSINKIKAILTYDGLKASTLFPYRNGSLRNKFKELGIHGRITPYSLTHKVIFIAKDECTLDLIDDWFGQQIRLVSIRQEDRNELWNKEFYDVSYGIGILLGYPESSIQAYIGEKERSSKWKEERRTLMNIMPFVNSVDNYEEEKRLALKWEKHIMKNYPLLYVDYLLDII
ncbi:hypothetical protein COV16_04965 [Candidatus Woesearchaeota archaeon CG10_big_fil_rev_8_21_14_0_10_34_8]|jgi:hypothetical protein|nr:MAG: hypothetical protein COV16_04965 [Candidatus Woesearchaeota archaeon CG10_big_fil_rev_8_21_14_0_10_34_8]